MEDTTIRIAEGNFGFSEVINITSDLLAVGDILTFIIKVSNDTEERIIEKEYEIEELEDNTYSLDFVLIEEETELLPAGHYIWGIEQSRTGALQDLPIESNFYGQFIVEKGV